MTATSSPRSVASDEFSPDASVGELANNENSDTRLITESQASVLTNITHSLSSSLRWCPTSEEHLAQAEADVLKVLSRPFRKRFVNIGSGWGLESVKINTLEMLTDDERESNATVATGAGGIDAGSRAELAAADHAPQSNAVLTNKKQPLVLIHGFAAGIGTWILNLDPLASTLDRKVYAIDLLGFARSTRAPLDLSGDVEAQFVDSIERWRKKVGIDRFILLGHSFGGYLSASYALKYPDHVSHVILADPWGVQDRQASPIRNTHRLPIWVRVVNSIFQSFNPLAVLRASGPYGPSLVQKFRSDIKEKFRPKLQDDCNKILIYIYHCNAQAATGESGFKALALPYGWPKNPLIHRLLDLHESVSLTFIYGSRSWIEKAPGEFLRDCMRADRVVVKEIEGSGHHVYADKYEQFNELVREACSRIPD